MADVPHFALPFSWSPSGHAYENEQDTPDDVAACVEAFLLCPYGWRAELVEYGLPDQTMLVDLDTDAIGSAIERWEPRADFQLAEDPDLDLLLRRVRITVGVST